ncbi:GerW family sporulation protein [Desulfoscipio sp. XC116]|uniref:GerW family sporulation protein n=1 Tax=Desulfoscipio sp. XC116 TaxID=3144975 RepID=UPI00325B9165
MPEQMHPIEGLMKTAMESIKEMVDVNTVVGDPVETPDGSVIIPISRVACGFGAGGGEFDYGGGEKDQGGEGQMPGFGGGSGAGVSVKPVGFLVAGNGQVRLIPVDGNATLDRLIDLAPQVFNQIQSLLDRRTDPKIDRGALT